jgi:hypothetical protein
MKGKNMGYIAIKCLSHQPASDQFFPAQLGGVSKGVGAEAALLLIR